MLYLLREGGAHAGFDAAVKDMPVAARGKRPEGAEHSPWELLEHMRIVQWDILEFSRDGEHASPKWPEGYWPGAARAAEENLVGQERGGVSQGFEGHVRSGCR
ncbi:MAG: DinB family protein [Hyphomicrobium sp.]